jgi:hypothetical protein
MDIVGAKALKSRLDAEGATAAPPVRAVEVPDDAPPVYHYLGVASETPAAGPDEAPAGRGRSLFRRLRRISS